MDHQLSLSLARQAAWLFLLAIPVACVAWTVTHEEIFREPRDYCLRCSQSKRSLLVRKFFYVFTCEYCFSHYVVILLLLITRYHLLFDDWRGYIIAGFSIVWIANIYMSVYNFVRIDIKKENLEISLRENNEETTHK